jgi:hypothetical protein
MSNSIGDLKNSGLQGNNWPWQYKVLLGLDGIINAIGANGTEYEAQIIKATCPGPTPSSGYYLEIRIYNTTTGTFNPPVYYLPGSTTPVNLSACTKEYANDSLVLTQILTELQDQGLTLDAIETAVEGTLDIRPLTCTDVVSLCFDNAGTPTTVSNTNPLPVNAIVTVPSALDTALFAFDITSGVNEALTTTETSPGTQALDVNLTTRLDCTTDSIAICDGTGNALLIDSNGFIGSNLFAQDATTGNQGPLTFTGTGLANALDVNITTLGLDIRALDCDSDSIKICNGTTDLGINLDGSINTQSSTLDGSGNAITSLLSGSRRGLDVNILTPNVAVSIGSLVETGVTGDLSSFGQSITSIAFQNIGTTVATISVDGGANFFPLAPGTSLNLDPRIPMGYYDGTSFFWDATAIGASLLIIYNYI